MTPEQFDREVERIAAAAGARAAATVGHVRIHTNARGRSWCGSPGRTRTVAIRTVCGADPTDRDLGPVRRDGTVPRTVLDALRCDDCRRLLEGTS